MLELSLVVENLDIIPNICLLAATGCVFLQLLIARISSIIERHTERISFLPPFPLFEYKMSDLKFICGNYLPHISRSESIFHFLWKGKKGSSSSITYTSISGLYSLNLWLGLFLKKWIVWNGKVIVYEGVEMLSKLSWCWFCPQSLFSILYCSLQRILLLCLSDCCF